MSVFSQVSLRREQSAKLTWPSIPRKIRRRERPRTRELLLLREITLIRWGVRVRRGNEEPAKRVDAPDVEEEEALEVYRPHAIRERVRERVEREGQEVRGDRRRKLREVVCARERVDTDRLDGRAGEEQRKEWLVRRDMLLRGEAVRRHGVDSGDEGVDGGVIVCAGEVVRGVEDDV